MYASPAMMTQLRMRGQPMTAGGAAPMNGPGGGGLLSKLADAARAKSQNMNPQLPYFEEDRQRLGDMLGGRSPFAGNEWGGLIQQLTRQASGAGPSLAAMNFRSGMDATSSAIGSQVRGSGSAAAGRQGVIQQGRLGQGLSAGMAQAKTQEMLGAQGALTQALGTRDQLNQGAYLDILGAQLGLSRAQLEALAGNADRKQSGKNADKQASAAKWGAIGGGLGGLAML